MSAFFFGDLPKPYQFSRPKEKELESFDQHKHQATETALCFSENSTQALPAQPQVAAIVISILLVRQSLLRYFAQLHFKVFNGTY